jgi:hypothetical protein
MMMERSGVDASMHNLNPNPKPTPQQTQEEEQLAFTREEQNWVFARMLELQREVEELKASVTVSQGQVSASGSTRTRAPKMAMPQVFTRKMADVHSFQTACYLYIIAKPDEFPNGEFKDYLGIVIFAGWNSAEMVWNRSYGNNGWG